MTINVHILDENFNGYNSHWKKQWEGRSVEALKLDGFHYYQSDLREELSVVVSHKNLDVKGNQHSEDLNNSDVIIIVPDWHSWLADDNNYLKFLADLRTRYCHSHIVLFDIVDQSSTPFLEALPYVDSYIKSQLLTDLNCYTRDFSGGYIFAEWMQENLDFDLEDWSFGSRCKPDYLDKLTCGWNMGISRFYQYLRTISDFTSKSWIDREIAVNRRFSIPDKNKVEIWEWYQEYRRFAGIKASELDTLGIVTGSSPISKFNYFKEMMNSRIVFSPFGWGEVCFRDFEAVACGAVLVKPDMSHIQTNPNIFIPYETYVPVKWDLSDLKGQCSWVLSNPVEANQMAENARARIQKQNITSDFVSNFGSVISNIDNNYSN